MRQDNEAADDRAAAETKSDEAGTQPTARILAVLADPELLGSNTSEKIRRSGLSKADWYRHRNDSNFQTRMALACAEALDEHTGSVLEALAESAQAPGRSGHQDRKLFLQLVGHQMSGAAPAGAEVGEQKPLSDTELVEAIIEAHKGEEHVLRYLLPPGVLRVMGYYSDTPKELLPDLQARRGLDPAKCAEYVARIRASIAKLPPNERGDPA